MKAQTEYELWLAIKDLYLWRTHKDYKFVGQMNVGSEPHIEAYKLWKSHPREDIFFAANQIQPEG